MTTFFWKTVTVSAERQLHVGDTMSNFTLMSSDLTLKSLSDTQLKSKIAEVQSLCTIDLS